MKNKKPTSPAHTAAPWKIGIDDIHSKPLTFGAGSQYKVYIGSKDSLCYALIGGPDESVREANARLIARAPRLFETVNALMDRLKEIDPDYYRSDLIAAADDVLAEIDGVRDEPKQTT